MPYIQMVAATTTGSVVSLRGICKRPNRGIAADRTHGMLLTWRPAKRPPAQRNLRQHISFIKQGYDRIAFRASLCNRPFFNRCVAPQQALSASSNTSNVGLQLDLALTIASDSRIRLRGLGQV